MPDYRAYPPQLADDVEIAEQRDGERTVFMVGAASVGRYLLLRATERSVLELLKSGQPLHEVCAAFQQAHGAKLSPTTLSKFLTKIDEAGLLAGERAQSVAEQPQPPHSLRFSLFNPDALFARMVPKLRWIWTRGFVAVTGILMLLATWLTALNWNEVTTHAVRLLSEHYLIVFLASMLVICSHEFAHGLTCKAFGGRATEVGVLMLYYFLPALYCNVSGIHLIPQRNRRLWVIAAGLYWQMLVGTVALLLWFLLAPETGLADVALGFCLGSVADVIFNANPLIKLDGYYFLSQWLATPNLMDRSRAYWRGLLWRCLTGERAEKTVAYSGRERTIYVTFGLLSFIYTAAFIGFILVYVGEWLMDTFYLFGLWLTLGVALLFVRRPLRQLFTTLHSLALRLLGRLSQHKTEVKMAVEQTTNQAANSSAATPSQLRRRLVPSALGLLILALLLMPWSASVGNYGKLVALPGQETIIRAPESATLTALQVQPGGQVGSGARIGQMGNLEVDEQLVQVQAELARAQADYDRLLGELRARHEANARAEFLLSQRQYEFNEINREQQQIAAARHAEAASDELRFISASTPNAALPVKRPAGAVAARYPAALAALQSETELRRAKLAEANLKLSRARQLYAQGLVARSELDAAETWATTSAHEMAAARDRFDAALVEHRRKHSHTATEMQVARTERGAAVSQVEKLEGELRSMRGLLGTLETRLALLQRKQAQFALLTPRAGTVFGEELPRQVGQYFQKGQEICRIADTRQLLLRVQVPDREIGDVRVGHPVRLKVRALPGQTFHGTVSKIGSESERDENQQVVWRVELTIENQESSLRPGMTAFARIDYGRQALGRILAHKLVQALRPELWLL
jgi:putative peptide zinc metalloprotease protein